MGKRPRNVSGCTIEGQANIGSELTEKLFRHSDNSTTNSSVSIAEVALPEHGGCHRLLHIHNNVPSMMTSINNVFSENGVNIAAQYLPTNKQSGYVVIGVDVERSDVVALDELSSLEGTLRCRSLF